jgi:CHAT domain-containing protein/Tfp pilus assembly protein PilF
MRIGHMKRLRETTPARLAMIALFAATSVVRPAVAQSAAPAKTAPAAAGPHAAELAEAQRLNDEMDRLYKAGRRAEAVPLARRILAIREKALEPSHPDLVGTINDLGILLEESGDVASAEPFFRRALAIREKSLGPNHPDVAQSLAALGGFLQSKGDIVGAELLLRRALSIWEKVQGPDHPDVAAGLGYLGGLYEEIGDYETAEAMIRRAQAIWEKAYGPDDTRVAAALSNLAMIRTQTRDFSGAEELLRRALLIREKALGPDHPELAPILNKLGKAIRYREDYRGAEPYYRRALAILEKTHGPNHPDVAASLLNLANLLQIRGDRQAAEQMMRRVLAIREKTYGPNHSRVASILDSLADLLAAKGDYEGAQPLQDRALQIEDRDAMRVLQAGSLRQKDAYFATLKKTTYGAISMHAKWRPESESALRIGLRTVLRRKGLASEVGGAVQRALEQHADPADRKKVAELSSKRAELARLTLGGNDQGESSEQHRAELRQLEQDVEQLERDMSAHYAALGVAIRPVEVEEVQKAIPEGAVLVEYVLYQPYNPKGKSWDYWGSERYGAYLLPANGKPTFVDLGDALSINRAVATYRDLLARIQPDYAKYARQLDALVMAPIRARLNRAADIYIAPDGPLNLAPFAALIDEHGHFLVERYRFNLLTTGRDLLRFKLRHTYRSAPLVMGGPDFGEPGTGNERSENTSGTRSANFHSVYFEPLEAARLESEQVGRLLSDATVLTDGKATEGALKKAHAPRILHVATHGFFLDKFGSIGGSGRGIKVIKGRVQTPSSSTKRKDDPLEVPENPMLRAGLAFAGANRLESGDDDGILTALEASELDLMGTQLVVLSACETGVGDVDNGDGVYGLRRALVLSGSETQLMSLWKIDDESTRKLMLDYYHRVLGGEGRIDAFRRSQLAMAQNSATSHPYYWAGFFAAGDSRTLDYRDASPVLGDGDDAARLKLRRGGCACSLPGSDTLLNTPGWLLLGAVCVLWLVRRGNGLGRGRWRAAESGAVAIRSGAKILYTDRRAVGYPVARCSVINSSTFRSSKPIGSCCES